MRCQACLHENRSQALFCEGCGERLSVSCRACDSLLQAGARFCDACGTPVAMPTGTPESDAERRQLTVMFCDLVGSTHLSERVEPEELRELVRGYHGLCARLIADAGGYLAQFLGDGVLAYFGYPMALDEDATAAVRTGLRIVRELSSHDDSARLAVRIGIHSGLVIAEPVGLRDPQAQLAVGNTVNLAARLQGLAQPNTVVMSAATQHLTRGFFDLRDLGPRSMKGVSRRVHAYEVLGESGAESRIEAASGGGLTPLVGRDAERRRLFDEWEHVTRGEGRIVMVSGEPGIGKSRLLHELKQQVAPGPHWRFECRCSPRHESSALYPVIDVLQRLSDAERDPEPFERLKRAVAPFVAGMPDALPLLADLLSIAPPDEKPPIQLTAQRKRERTLEVLAAVLVGMSKDRPLLLIVEDLHWIDPSTLEFLDLLMRVTPRQRILFLLLFRPSFVPPWRDAAGADWIELARLTEEEAGSLIRSVAGDRELPPEVLVALIGRADGIPLYLEELTKTLLESDQLRERDGRYELAGPLESVAIPVTLHESLLARLDRLAPIKEVVQLGATLGRSFPWELLCAVSGLDEATLREELQRLVDADVLQPLGSAPDPTGYVFKHALIQEAAYASLLKNRRRDYHRRIAETVEARFPDLAKTQPELLGLHYSRAGLASEAAAQYRQAGRRAIERSASVEAASHLERALELIATLEPGPERIRSELETRIDLGVSLVASRGFTAPEVEAVYAKAKDLCNELGEQTYLFYNALGGIFLFHQARGELRTALELTEQRVRLAEHLDDRALRMQVNENLGTLAFWRGDFEAALPSLEEALSRYDAPRARDLALVYGTESGVVCETYVAQVLWFLGRPDAALQRCHRAVARARELGHANSLGLALAFAAALHQLRREPERVRALADETVAFSTEQHLRFWCGMGTIFQGWSLVALGDVEAGISRMLAGVTGFQDTGAGLGGPLCLAMLAEAHVEAGQPDAGLELLKGGLGLLGPYEDRFFDAEVLRVKGELLMACSRPDLEEAEACFTQALELSRRQGARALQLRCASSLARLRSHRGDAEEAQELLAKVYAGFREGFDTPDLRDAAALLGERT